MKETIEARLERLERMMHIICVPLNNGSNEARQYRKEIIDIVAAHNSDQKDR